MNLVYSVASRMVHDGHLAEEITQAVFIILARKAADLGERVILTGWLCRTARYVSARALRDQARRRKREHEVFMQSPANDSDSATDWMQISPSLDEAMNKLGQTDHDAIVLRFFENKSLAEVGQALGTTEGAAKMRVNRALDRLRKLFTKKGIALSAAAIAAGMTANSVKAAPAGLAKSAALLATAKASGAAASTLTLVKATIKSYTWLKLKFALITGTTLLVAGVVTMLLAQNHPGNSTESAFQSDTNTFPLDLTTFYTTPGGHFKNMSEYPGFGTMPQGQQVFEGVPLKIGGMICLWGGVNTTNLHIVFPEQISAIPVKQQFETLYVYHGAFFKSPPSTPVWDVVFHYSDGSSSTNHLLYGDDVLDWHAKMDGGGSVIGPTDPRSRLAWTGGSSSTNRVLPLRMCLTAIENPQPALTVDTIDLVSCKSWTAPCIMAITAGKSGMMP